MQQQLIISRINIGRKKLGLHPGDRIEIRTKMVLKPVTHSPEESHQITESLERLRDAIDPSELDNWETQRNELWSKWQVPT